MDLFKFKDRPSGRAENRYPFPVRSSFSKETFIYNVRKNLGFLTPGGHQNASAWRRGVEVKCVYSLSWSPIIHPTFIIPYIASLFEIALIVIALLTYLFNIVFNIASSFSLLANLSIAKNLQYCAGLFHSPISMNFQTICCQKKWCYSICDQIVKKFCKTIIGRYIQNK